MIFSLNAFDGGGTDMGTISIHINPGRGNIPEAFAWEWRGPGINTGGMLQWSHNGRGFVMELFESAGRFGTLNNNWDIPPTPNNEPPRPWFSRPSSAAGIGSIAPGSPARLTAAFNWRLI